MEIRRAEISDAKVIYKLTLQLGYLSNLEVTESNIERMLSLSDYDLVVATDESHQVIGWMSLLIRCRIEDLPFLEVAALVVDETARGKGAGKLLMSYATSFAQKHRLSFVGLYSNKNRSHAHSFYESIGYSKAKESFFFKKEVK